MRGAALSGSAEGAALLLFSGAGLGSKILSVLLLPSARFWGIVRFMSNNAYFQTTIHQRMFHPAEEGSFRAMILEALPASIIHSAALRCSDCSQHLPSLNRGGPVGIRIAIISDPDTKGCLLLGVWDEDGFGRGAEPICFASYLSEEEAAELFAEIAMSSGSAEEIILDYEKARW